MAYRKILAAIDRSELGQQVFEQALTMAKQEKAALMLFHCLPLENASLTPYTTLYSEDITQFSRSIRDQLTSETKEIQIWLAEYTQIASNQGIAAEWDWKIGDPGRWVRDIAQNWQADLIVTGRRGLQGIAEMFLGSVSNYIVHHAPCSVLVVQAEEKAVDK